MRESEKEKERRKKGYKKVRRVSDQKRTETKDEELKMR